MNVHICKVSDTDFAVAEDRVRDADMRDELLGIWNVVQWTKTFPSYWRQVRNMDVLCHYGISIAPSRRRRVPVDVPAMIEQWKIVIVTLATAHDKEAIDKAEYRMDELLTPLLKAPVAQLKEFHEGLQTQLREDPNVPFFIWSMFNAWGKVIVERSSANDTEKKLKKKLAKEVAALVEPAVKNDIVKAMTGALMWRNPETLQQIKEDVENGAKPKIKGKESCLFLTTKRRGQPERQVML